MKVMFRFVIGLLVTFNVAACVVLREAQADPPIPNFRCVTILNPLTCASTGNSACNTLAGDLGFMCNGSAGCTYCDDTTVIANKICLVWEHFGCAKAAGDVVNCAAASTKRTGACNTVNGSCGCANPVANGDCGNAEAAQPCNP